MIPSESILESFEEVPGLKGPPKATVAKRAKSYSDFYDAAITYLGKEIGQEKRLDIFEVLENEESRVLYESGYEKYEDDLLDASQMEYQLYRDQLALSERHIDGLLVDTTGALDLLAKLSESFKTVESQTTAFQAQCEGLLAEQKRIRNLADEVGTDLQYYAYLEPLTRRLNAPGSSRLVRSDDFLDMLINLNTCIDFMDQHPLYRDSTVYKTRYLSLLERSLNIVQGVFSSALKEVSDDVAKQLKAKEHNETAEYILMYGRYESLAEDLDPPLKTLLNSAEFAFGQKGDKVPRESYIERYHELYKQLVDAFLRSREPVGQLLLKNLKKFADSDPKPDTDFNLFSRRCVQDVLDVCHHELELAIKFFHHGPILSEYPELKARGTYGNYIESLEQNRLSHIRSLHTFLTPYLSNGDLHRVCDLVNWLENKYLISVEGGDENDSPQEYKTCAQVLLSEYLWPLSDSLFIKAAMEIEHFKPSPDDLKLSTSKAQHIYNEANKGITGKSENAKVQIGQEAHEPGSTVASAYPTVKTAVRLLIMYNDNMYDRPKKGDVLYEIVHQATESLQRAATTIKRTADIMSAQLFLIKNLMLIENLFMTHEIPESVRQSAELDFSPIWETIRELQLRGRLFNPLAYITPLVQGKMLPAVVDRVLDARKEMERVLVQQITAFTKHWRGMIRNKDPRKKEQVAKAEKELGTLLDGVFEDEATKAALWKMIRAEETTY